MGQNKTGTSALDPPVGLVRKGSIVSYDSTTNTMQVQLTGGSSAKNNTQSIPAPGNFPYIDSNGFFIGALPPKNTAITLAQGSGGQYYQVGYITDNIDNIPDLDLGQLLIYSSETSKIILDDDSNITLGSDIDNIHIFAGSQQYPQTNLITITFENENHFNQAFREVGGQIKRDTQPNPQAASSSGDTKLEDDSYDRQLVVIGLDPTATSNDLLGGPSKNPPLVEHRQMIYEFQYKSGIDNDILEAGKYGSATSQTQANYTTPNRRSSRSDTMSLSLVAPNFLMEEIKGTVVDIFGNILDINRMPIPVGMSSSTTLKSGGTTGTTNPAVSYQNIRALERKSIAYHFEINARKDPAPANQGNALGINDDNYNAKLQRSRFSFDVDKEGQFKLNVPASSESGNIPLLTRAENYSTFATTDGSNPNQLWFIQNGQSISQDIFVDSFAAPMKTPSSAASGFDIAFDHGSIILQDYNSQANLGPQDRISQFAQNNSSNSSPYNIRHGTAYHDILQTCIAQQQTASVLKWPVGQVDSPNIIVTDGYGSTATTDGYSIKSALKTSSEWSPPPTIPITDLSNVVSSTIKIGSVGASSTSSSPPGTANGNAGGRSGSINLDGSLELNIGANTVDRQSLWLDTAGGIVANVGRDINQRSLIMGLDGDALIQIGGYGVSGDARFTALGQDGQYNGTLDIRVMNNGFVHMIRVDSTGITIMSPGNISMHAGQNMIISADGEIEIDCEALVLQKRKVKKIFGGSI